jgi:DNA-binding transcriptional MerR regulator
VRREKEDLRTIGEVARKSGVPVKTIRHYSDVGVLPPSGVTGSGYRLYSARDLSRLELVRNLRAAGFDLGTIRRLIESRDSPAEALKLQLETVDLQLRTLQRRRKLLESTLAGGGGEASASHPDRVWALGLLEAREREAFLGEHLERSLEGIPMNPDVKAWFWRAIVSGMPAELDDEQLRAWVELAELASDESFVEAIRAQTRPVWEEAADVFDPDGWSEAAKFGVDEAVRAVREGRSPSGEREQRVVAEWVAASARAMGRGDDPRFDRWLLSHYEGTYDPRFERYWELISTLKRWEYDPGRAEAHRWLVEGLRRRVEGGS